MGEQTTLPLLTASRLRDARACQRRHKYRYLDGYAPLEDTSPRRFGTMFHRALEAWWRCASNDARLDVAMETLPPDGDKYDLAMARALIVGYDARWRDETLVSLSVEGEFRVPLRNPETGAMSRTWELGGKLDAVARDAGHRLLLVEHKTTIDDITPGSDYWKRLRLDGQISIYFQGARAAGYHVEACLYDVIRKPLHRPLKATAPEDRKFKKDGTLYSNQRDIDETPEEYEARLVAAIGEDPRRYFVRGEVVRLDAEMDEAMFDAWTLAKQLREAEIAERFPRNPDACVTYGRTCSFFGVCSGEQSLDDPLLFRRMDNVHPELSQVTS